MNFYQQLLKFRFSAFRAALMGIAGKAIMSSLRLSLRKALAKSPLWAFGNAYQPFTGKNYTFNQCLIVFATILEFLEIALSDDVPNALGVSICFGAVRIHSGTDSPLFPRKFRVAGKEIGVFARVEFDAPFDCLTVIAAPRRAANTIFLAIARRRKKSRSDES